MVDKNQVIMGVATLAAAVAGATAAQASDLPSKSSPKAPTPSGDDWSGLYVGVSIGAGSGKTGFWDSDYDVKQGYVAGAHLGVNVDLGNHVVAGGEIACSMGPRALESTMSYEESYGISPIIDLKGRLGFDMGSTLVYGFGGVSHMPIHNYAYEYSNYGYNVGAGIEYKVARHMPVGVEYIHRATVNSYHFPSYSDTDTSLDEVSLRASYNF